MGFLDDDIDTMLTDLHGIDAAVDVTYSSTTVKGIMDTGPATATDESGLVMELVGQSVLIKAGAISPSVGDTITVDGTDRVIRSIDPEPRDAKMTRIMFVDA